MTVDVIAQSSTYAAKVGITDSDGAVVTDLTNWVCAIQLRNKRTGELAGTVDRNVTAKNFAEDRFLITLVAADTDIPEGFYYLGVEFSNATTAERKELIPPLEIQITEGYVYE